MEGPTKVPILGKKDNIIVDNHIWPSFIIEDLLQNVTSSTYLLVTDTNLWPIYGPPFQTAFETIISKLKVEAKLLTYQIAPGETAKSRATKDEAIDWMLSAERDPPLDTKTVIIALGGGVIGDLFGYVAATFKRGIRFVNVPSSLLAMVDSSIGGKTAIDTPAGKNLEGAFHQPSKIYIDLQFLNSLPTREFINGMAEVVKTAAIWNKDEFEALEGNSKQLMGAIKAPPTADNRRLSDVKEILKRIVVGSVQVKAEVVSADEKEGGLRNLLNFGHSIGHAIEGILTPQILHGECVAIGMILEAELSRYLGYLDGIAVARLKACLASYQLPTSLQDSTVQERSAYKHCSVNDLLSVMAVDKKNQGRKKRIVLLESIGRVHGREATVVSDKDIRVILSSGIHVEPFVGKSLKVSCIPPGSKSISNRALLLAALGKGTCRIRNFLQSDDTKVMMKALTETQAAEFAWEEDKTGSVLVVTGKGGDLKASENDLDLGNAGTASRFLTTAATLAVPGSQDFSILTGNKRMQQRPIGDLVDALRANGATVQYVGKSENPNEKEKSLPLKIQAAGGMKGGDINLAANFSSQYVSSILMCAPYAKESVTLRLVGGKPISQLYIDLTISMMRSFGIEVTKSSIEEHTYHIPQSTYHNPPEYEIESDASSATYPLAIAAITGGTCTVPNIGSASLQGDSRFARDVLEPMGATVQQDESSTTVTGPPKGTLKPIPLIDMEPMTDAFLTASVLAAVARGREKTSTTRIVGIKNQHKKECDRIQAMETELAKFGVKCRGSEDGIEIDGIDYKDLREPKGGIHCYDDHRVAMSFSVLALASPCGALIQERECTGKTWPGWWDTLRQIFDIQMEGVDLSTPLQAKSKVFEESKRSIFLIGMRGAGKTTTGKWISEILDRPFVDLDSELESVSGQCIPEIIKKSGWEGFREQELALLKKTMQQKPTDYVFACGGGIVEIPEARQMLVDYHSSGGLVILVQRDIEDVMAYLQLDKSRPAYVDDMRGVWLRRKHWYKECSNYEHFSQQAPAESLLRASRDLQRFIRNITGKRRPLQDIKAKNQSFFVSLTIPDIAKALHFLPHVVVGSDAIELRVDLLEDPAQPGKTSSIEYVANQLAILHGSTDLPIVFTVRTESQGGKFPDGAHDEAFNLYKLALRMGVEFLDLEIHFPDSRLCDIVQSKGHTKIIASHHDPQGILSWSNNSWVPHFNKALLYGDIIKLVGGATASDDNKPLQQFKAWARSQTEVPLIAIQMGRTGQLSRIQNGFLTPVSHPALPFKAAPGQLSAAEIRTALTLHGAIEPRKFFLSGSPIAQSKSPAMHNAAFQAAGLPHEYNLFETSNARDLGHILYSPDFGGASVTIPLKLDIMPHLDSISSDARTIGAVNTIITDPSRPSSNHPGNHLTGRNTDWQGMSLVLENAGAASGNDQSGLVIGGGGTARAAIYTLHHALKCSPIYVLGRSQPKIKELIDSFPKEYNLRPLSTREEGEAITTLPTIAIGTIPADKPIDPGVETMLKHIFHHAKAGILLEMAYKPAVTPLMELAHTAEWKTIPGLEVLAGQAYYQFEAWTGIWPFFEGLRAECGLSGGKGEEHKMNGYK
ncbi:3-dehydroquinate dehydratase (3-dehydroquinase) [Lecanora helva]